MANALQRRPNTAATYRTGRHLRTVRRLASAPLRALRSLQWQLAASYAAMAALLCTALGLVIMQVLGQRLLQQDRIDVQNRAVIAADLVYRSLAKPPNLQFVLDEASTSTQARVCIYDPSGNQLENGCSDAGLNPMPEGSLNPEPDVDVQSALTPIAPSTGAGAGQGSAVFGYVALFDPLTFRRPTERAAQAAIFRLSLVATAIAAGAGLLLGRGLTAPLRALIDAARRLGTGDLQARAPEDGDDEIGELGAQFNRMATQLQDSFATLESERDTLRTFIADMSHELRTPITALRTFNDLLSGGAAADAEVRDEFLDESGKQIERLEWLAQNLLDLSKFDAGLAGLQPSRLDLSDLVGRVVEDAQRAGEQKGVTVSYRPPSTLVEANADPRRLEQALSNVLLNGVKFTPTGGEVHVGVERQNGHALIRVEDTGPGIPADELPHIFERFYRGPSTATLASGSGLGLPIVQSIMHAHGGEVDVHSEVGKGTEVVLTVPAP